MSLRRNLPVPLRQSRPTLKRGLPAFVRPYLLLILASAILLSFVIASNDTESTDQDQVEGSHSQDAQVDGPPAGSSAQDQFPARAPTKQQGQVAAIEVTPTPIPSATPIPTATATPSPQANSDCGAIDYNNKRLDSGKRPETGISPIGGRTSSSS